MFPQLWVSLLSFHQVCMMTNMWGLIGDWLMVTIYNVVVRGLRRECVRLMWMFVDCFRVCKFLWHQGISVILWRMGWRRMKNLCRTRKCVRFSNGCQWRVRLITHGQHVFKQGWADLLSAILVFQTSSSRSENANAMSHERAKTLA